MPRRRGLCQRIDRFAIASGVGLKVLDERLVGALLIEHTAQLVLGDAGALHLFLEAVQDEELDRIAGGSQAGPAGVAHRCHRAIEHVEEYRRPRTCRVPLVPA